MNKNNICANCKHIKILKRKNGFFVLLKKEKYHCYLLRDIYWKEVIESNNCKYHREGDKIK